MLTLWRLEILVVAAILVALFALFAKESATQGHFSPDTLETKSRSLYGGIPGPATVSRHRLTEYLVAKGYWSASSSEPRWLTMYEYRAGWKDGQSYLQSALFWKTDTWIEWSESYPKRASVLWPRVLEILRGDHEDAQSTAAELLLFVRHAETEAEFNSLLTQSTNQH